jgi:hypothetical protein
LNYGNRFGDQLTNAEINDLAWDIIFLNYSDPELLQLGLKLTRKSIAGYPNADYHNVDTYANLLYKVGNIKNAILWEEKVIDLKSNMFKGDLEQAEATLKKMQVGEKTWPAIPFSPNR